MSSTTRVQPALADDRTGGRRVTATGADASSQRASPAVPAKTSTMPAAVASATSMSSGPAPGRQKPDSRNASRIRSPAASTQPGARLVDEERTPVVGEAHLLAEAELVAGRGDRTVTGAAPDPDERQQGEQLVVERRAGCAGRWCRRPASVTVTADPRTGAAPRAGRLAAIASSARRATQRRTRHPYRRTLRRRSRFGRSAQVRAAETFRSRRRRVSPATATPRPGPGRRRRPCGAPCRHGAAPTASTIRARRRTGSHRSRW